MGITIGDALTVVSIVAALGLSAWASMIAANLLFSNRTARASSTIAATPWRIGFSGLVVGFIWLAITTILASIPNPLTKLIAFGLYGLFMAVTAVGAGGLARLMRDRICAGDPQFSITMALARAATWIVLVGLLPMVGWFLLAPVMLCVSFGAGVDAVRAHRTAPASDTVIQ